MRKNKERRLNGSNPWAGGRRCAVLELGGRLQGDVNGPVRHVLLMSKRGLRTDHLIERCGGKTNSFREVWAVDCNWSGFKEKRERRTGKSKWRQSGGIC